MAKRKVRISLIADCGSGYCWFKENNQCPFSQVIGKDKEVDVMVESKNDDLFNQANRIWLDRANRGEFEIGTCTRHHELDSAMPERSVRWEAPSFGFG